MTEIAAIILLARNDEPGNGGWIQLVIFVILGLVYALSGLAKMKANKAAEEEDKTKEEPKRKPRYKPLDDIFPPREAEAKGTAAPKASRMTPRPAREARRPTEKPIRREHKRVARIPEVKKRPARVAAKPTLPTTKKPMPPMPSLETAVPSELGKIEKLGIGLSSSQKEGEQELAGRAVLNYENPDALREAIVHYEILGKPLSLRGPGQHMWEV